MNRLDRGTFTRPMMKPDMAGGPTSDPKPERKLVPEGPLQAERQAFIDVAREVLKVRGYGDLNWSSVSQVPSKNVAVLLAKSVTSWAGTDAGPSNWTRLAQNGPDEYQLVVDLNGRDVSTDNVEITLCNGYYPLSSNGERTTVEFNAQGEVVSTHRLVASDVRRSTRKLFRRKYWVDHKEESREAYPDEVEQTLADATAFLKDVLESSEWKGKPTGPVYHRLTDEQLRRLPAFVGG